MGEELSDLEPLRELDPEAYAAAEAVFRGREVPPEAVELAAGEGAWALSLERGFGRVYTAGLARLAVFGPPRALTRYRRLVRRAAGQGATLASAVAAGTAPILAAGDARLLSAFLKALPAMSRHGAHALARPVEGFLFLLSRDERAAARAYADLCTVAFGRVLSYHQALTLTQVLPAVARSIPPGRRAYQLAAWARVAQRDPRLAPVFAEGLMAGLSVLGEEGLGRFSREGLARFDKSPEAGLRFFGLETAEARSLLSALSTSAPFSGSREALARYLSARTGRITPVRGFSALEQAVLARLPEDATVVSDGQGLYFREELDILPAAAENRDLYKALARLEAGLLEFSTFDFDAETARDLALAGGVDIRLPEPDPAIPDLTRFFAAFPVPALARDLLTALEHGRVRSLSLARYPGLADSTFTPLARSLSRLFPLPAHFPALGVLYRLLAFGPESAGGDARRPDPAEQALVEDSLALFGQAADHPPFTVEKSAAVAARLYQAWEDAARAWFSARFPGALSETYRPLAAPFGRGIFPELAWNELQRRAELMRRKLKGISVELPRRAIEALLAEKGGGLTKDDLARLIPDPETREAAARELALDRKPGPAPESEPGAAAVFRYPEWNEDLNDHLPDHCRVAETEASAGDPSFYGEVVARRRGLVLAIRKSFELLRPQGLVLQRRVMEGDGISLSAVVDHAVDRRAGLVPSERIYTRRVRQIRDVAVLLMADVSRSTGNLLPGGVKTVLDVEKEALVLFCEALSAAGDAFSLAAFSGAGRLRVDFIGVKSFAEAMSPAVRARIAGLAPARNTRVGAAVRHAAFRLLSQPARTRLLILLSDGFPNDLDYKGSYAISDTRKAIRETRAKNIAVHAVTVNLSDAARLDEIYGEVGHTLISHVRDLPEKLVRLYRGLTR